MIAHLFLLVQIVCHLICHDYFHKAGIRALTTDEPGSQDCSSDERNSCNFLLADC